MTKAIIVITIYLAGIFTMWAAFQCANTEWTAGAKEFVMADMLAIGAALNILGSAIMLRR